METKRIKFASTAITLLFVFGIAQSTIAQSVDVRMSARETYVGMPIVLQIAINNAGDYQEPVFPAIDGCDIRAAGSPSQSSQITIINGRRSESRSVTMQYLITPRREGTFEIPALTINVDGRDRKTEPLRFVATKSETGDLLFVEIEGDRDKVFVGQPLDLTLKIWVKPFVDRERNIKLSEANMWQMISQQTSWGSFGERLKEMAANNQRPGGREVLRDDINGNEREYYLYEIEGTVYPKRPGRIDADDVQIVVNYPTALGKSRDPFQSFFKDSPFGGSPFGASSRLSQLMDDDFFGSSPFGNRLAVSATRPVVGEAAVGSTEVVAVPEQGRPADYRGAVGRYQIVTQATPTAVSAGDPITLNIGILGTGPMELVQAPPLTELSSLTTDFKVDDQYLAGFVKNETKVFPTTIRPRREGITQIPAIPFSFFDPNTETFETVMSEPIAITVDKSESLALDAIVGNSRRIETGENNMMSQVAIALQPDFSNHHTADVLVSQSAMTTGRWWWAFVVVPPVFWLAALLVRNYNMIFGRLPTFKSARAQCLSAIEQATDRAQIQDALIRFIRQKTGRSADNAITSVGALRTAGWYPLANEVESFFQSCEHSAFNGSSQQSTVDMQRQARQLVEKMEAATKSMNRNQVRRFSRREAGMQSGRTLNGSDLGRSTRRTSLLLLATLFACSTNNVLASDESRSHALPVIAKNTSARFVELSASQQQTILQEAGEIYAQATAIAATDSAEANDLFTTAAAKYQLLVDSGIRNSGLYINLGNACLQSNQLGRAIANYEQARQLDPGNRQLAVNLELANSLVVRNIPEADTAGPTTLRSAVDKVRSVNDLLISLIGRQSVIWLLAIASILFWGILIARAVGFQLIARRWAIAPLLVLVISLASVSLADATSSGFDDGIIITNNLTLRSGDSDQFAAVLTIESGQGQRVHVLARRSHWTQVRMDNGQIGWIENRNLELLN